MATNSRNLQINIFNKGMNTDTTDSYIGTDLYRMARNLRFVSLNGENAGELKVIEGYKYLDKISGKWTLILATDLIRNYGILIVLNDNKGRRDNEEPISRSRSSLFPGEEGHYDDNNYLPDGINPGENNAGIANPGEKDYYYENPIILDTKIDKEQRASSIVSGWSIYRIDNNDLTKKPVCIFGPCEDKIGSTLSTVMRWESDKNIKLYIADGLNPIMILNIVHEDGEQTKISYLTEYSDSKIYPALTNISNSRGNLKAAIVLYTYRLYSSGMPATQLAPISKAISLYNDTDKSAIKGYEPPSIANGILVPKNTNKAVDISIEFELLTRFDKILLYRINYIAGGMDPEINLIYDGNINGNHFNYIDAGSNISSIDGEELKKFFNIIKTKPLLIESKNDYLYAANIMYAQDEVDELFKDINAEETISIEEYRSIVPDYVFDKYGNFVGNKDKYGTTLRPGEKYRYGVVFYDNDGRRSSVKWIKDLDVRDESNIKIVNGDYLFYKVGIKVKVNKVIPNCSGYEIVRCKRGIEQSKVLYEGLMGLAIRGYKPGYDENNQSISVYSKEYCSNLFMSRMIDVDYTNTKYKENHSRIIQFSSPEYVYQNDDVQNVLNYSTNLLLRNKINYSTIKKGETLLYDTYDDKSGYPPVYYATVGIGENSDLNKRAKVLIFGQSYGSYWKLQNVIIPDGYKDLWHYYVGDNIVASSSYVYPIEELNKEDSSYSIKDIQYTDSPDPNSFNNGETIEAANNPYTIGENFFYNWYIPQHIKQENDYNNVTDDISTEYIGTYSLVSSGGKCIVMTLDGEENLSLYFSDFDEDLFENEDKLRDYINNNIYKILPITISQIVQSRNIDYGEKKHSVYYSHGNYIKYVGQNLVGDVIYDGDCYGGMFIYNSSHCFYTDKFYVGEQSVTYSVPIISNIDLLATCGDLYTRINDNYKYLLQDYAVTNLAGLYGQSKDAYIYNTAYNHSTDFFSMYTIEYTSIYSKLFDNRIIVSGLKINNEEIDSWATFDSSNFIDVDSRFGEITELKLFKDQLVFWLKSATGVISANERTILQDINKTNLLLGNGDILQRYDYITTEYGMKPNLMVNGQSNSTLYWWDGYKKEIVAYSGQLGILPMKSVKTILSYIDCGEESYKPCVVYDSKYNDVIINVVNNKPIAYNELLLQFVSIYETPFNYFIKFDDVLLLIYNNKVYQWNLYGKLLIPYLKYIINTDPTVVKIYDNVLFGIGELFDKDDLYFYNDFLDIRTKEWKYGQDLPITFKQKIETNLQPLMFTFKTRGQSSQLKQNITYREYDYRFAIPRNDNKLWGDRLRGKTMQCEVYTKENSTDFSIQYIITKFRNSWS